MGWPRHSLATIGPDRRDTGGNPARLSWAGPSSVPMQRVITDASGKNLAQADVEAALANKGISDAQKQAVLSKINSKKPYKVDDLIVKAQAGKVRPSRAGLPASARETAGFVNPAHFDPSVIDIHRQAAVSPRPAGRDEREWLASPSRHFRTYTPTHKRPPIIVKGHGETVLGHHLGAGAVDMWNAFGHKQPRKDNKKYNDNVARYHGLEEREASARSGGHTKERYRTPTPTSSDRSHWDPSHPDYFKRNHWNFAQPQGGSAAAAPVYHGGQPMPPLPSLATLLSLPYMPAPPAAASGAAPLGTSAAAPAPLQHGGQPMPPLPSLATLLSLPYMPAPPAAASGTAPLGTSAGGPVPVHHGGQPMPPLLPSFMAAAAPKPATAVLTMSSVSAFRPYSKPAPSAPLGHALPVSMPAPAPRADDEDDPMGMG